jgi:hypothetical protein
VTGDCHAGICGSLGVKFPQSTRPWFGQAFCDTKKVLDAIHAARTWEESGA